MTGTDTPYQPETLTQADLDSRPGWWLLEFGANGCPFCIAAQPAIAAAIGTRAPLNHLRIEDGRGRPLGRSFRVRLWPTLVLMHDGQVQATVVRPTTVADLQPITRWTDTLG